MIVGSVAVGFAVLLGVAALFTAPRSPAFSRQALIRISTMSPGEWRQYQEASRSTYERWARPLLLVWARRLRLPAGRVDRTLIEQAGLTSDRFQGLEFQALRFACGSVGLVADLLLSTVVPGCIAFAPLLTWAGSLAPVRYLARRRRMRQRQIRRELPDLVGMVRAFHRAGIPLERTLHLAAAQRSTFPVLGGEIEHALGQYGLGLALEDALEGVTTRTGVEEVGFFFSALAQGKRLGTGLDQTLTDHETVARLGQKNQATAEASRVGTKLLGILAGIYLPEFVVLIMIPLFLGIIQRAFG